MNTVTRKILLDRHISDEEYEVYLTLEPFKAEFWDSTKPPEDAYIFYSNYTM